MSRSTATIHGRLDGRANHVLADIDGTRRHPTWLNGLEHQRAWAQSQADDILKPAFGSLPAAVPVLARVGMAVGTSALGGVDALAPRLRRLFVGLGPTFIKFGQLVSGGSGMFPPRLVQEFESFRDRVPAEPFDHVHRVLAEEIPGGINAFATFDRQPLAAASIAQVHAATLLDGQRVVVKVQRPGIGEQVRRDLKWIATVAHILDHWVPPARAGNLPGIVEYFTETLMEELDFRLEAENQLDVAEAVSRSDAAAGVAVPRPHPTLVTRRVLVMERFDGFDSTDSAGMAAAGIDTETMLAAGFAAFAEGALVWGVFHGDLHPGNIMVLADGRRGSRRRQGPARCVSRHGSLPARCRP
jgi:ubiquinone biosynthesis protein